MMSKTEQVLVVLWIAIAAFIAYLAAGLIGSQEVVLQHARDQAQSYARLVEQHASAVFDRADTALMALTDHLRPDALIGAKSLTSARRGEIERLLLRQQQRTPGMINILLADANGDIYANSLGVRAGSIVSDRGHFQALKQDPRRRVAISESVLGRTSNKWGLQIGHRLESADGGFGGIVGATLGLDELFTEFYARLALGKDSAVTLRDPEDRLLVRYPMVHEKLGKPVATSGWIHDRLRAGDAEGTVISVSPTDNIERVFAFRRFAHYPIYATVGLSAQETLSGWRRERNAAIGGALLAVIAGAYITAVLRRKERTENLLAALAGIVESSEDAIAAADLNGVVTSWNAGAQRLYGYSAEEMIGQPTTLITPPEKSDELQSLIASIRAGRSIVNLETIRVRKDGRRIDVAVTVSSVRNAAGDVTGYSVIARDITRRKRAEEALRESEERYRDLTEMSSDWSWEQDAQFRVIAVSQAMYRITSLSPGTTLGKTRWELPISGVSEAEWALHRACLERHEPFNDFVYQLRNDAGEMRWFSVSGKPRFRANGEFRGYRGVGTDITERKRAEAAGRELEAQLRESQKLEAIGTLAGGIAHDFNNIVAAILGNVALAKKDAGAGRVTGTLVSLEEIDKAATRAKRLVQQILSFSRKQPQEFVTQPLRPLVEEALRLLRATLPAGVDIGVALADEPLHARVDATQIEQVVVNLCANAWHALEDRAGRVDIELVEVLVDAGDGGSLAGLAYGRYARIRVSDSGCGMDAATQARMFEPFYTTKPVGKGTGLGLAVVHGIVKSHQGVIKVESAPGKGTSIDVYLPLDEASAEDARPARDATGSSGAQGQHVLYVDDDEAMVLLMTRMLEDLGYRVSGYARADAAVDAVRADPQDFDLVVTDFNMPGLSGLEVAQELLRMRRELPVVIVSGYVTEELTAGARAAGVRQVVYKPNTVDELCAIIQRLLASGGV